MNICRNFLCFAIFSFIGWAYESAYYTLQQRKIVNSGFLSTCFCPIYGIGALLDLILLGWIENPAALFLAGVAVTGSLEYFVSWLLEALFHQRWWDYTGWPLNINGRVCALGAVVFGLMSVCLIKFIAPFTMALIDNLNVLPMYAITAIVAFVMLADTIKSVRSIDASKLWYVEKQCEVFESFGTERCENALRKIRDTFRR